MRRLFALLLLLVGLASPAAAQVTAEQITNHGTAASYTTPYTPATGTGRALLVLVTSEYEGFETSNITSLTLGGVPLTLVGTVENAANKKNRTSAYVLRGALIPPGTPTLAVSYGPDRAASLIYVATILNVDQTTLAAPPFSVSRDCVAGRGATGTQPMNFGPLNVRANDIVLSFVATGQNTAETTFQNGGAEFFDQRVFGPGFSLAGAIQSPGTDTTIAGRALITAGCANRPTTLQIAFRPLQRGADGTVRSPEFIGTNRPLAITVTDADLNITSSQVDTVVVRVRNRRTGQLESVTLTETGPATGVFTGTLPTRTTGGSASGSGGILALVGDELEVTYTDTLTATGDTAVQASVTRVTPPLQVVKSSTPLATTGPNRFAIPLADVVYTIEVTNRGDSTVDGGTLFVLDALPAQVELFSGAFGGGTAGPVAFTSQASGLTLAPGSVRYAGAGGPPASFAACTLTPNGGYDPAIRYLCVQPAGSMVAGDPDPSFTLRFRTRIR